jgi:hypothetical protein
MTRMPGHRYIILHGFTLSGSVPIGNWGSANMSWEVPLILTIADRFTCTEDEVVHGKTRVGTRWGRERSGQFVSPQDRFSCWARRGKQLVTRNSGTNTSSICKGEMLVHNLICPRRLYSRNLTSSKLYFTLT